MNLDAILAALMIPFAGTALGSAFVFFLKKDIPEILQKILLAQHGWLGSYLVFLPETY